MRRLLFLAPFALTGCADAPAPLMVAVLAIGIGLLTVGAIACVVAKVLLDMKRDGGR